MPPPIIRRLAVLLAGVALAACSSGGGSAPSATPTIVATATPVVPPIAMPAPEYVGRGACLGCHAEVAATWGASQHAAALQPANIGTVLGDFAGATFEYGGVTSTFSRSNDDFVVRTDDANGKLADFRIAYTFGLYPLQQYLVDFPDGRKQALSIAWDARPETQGGQRWFHLYPDETIGAHDPLHWTRAEQNWNFACADCHSTNLRRNYDAATDTYATTWTDPSVACESCHGPGSNHVTWAGRRPGTEGWRDHGLAIALDDRVGVTWTPVAVGAPIRSKPLASHTEVETCAVCHARRRPLGADPGPTGKLLDTHMPSLLEAPLYEPDGQQHDEVYTWGSFVQSKMYARGVTCGDCHEPHSGRLRAAGNAVCAQCHSAGTYDGASHHRHGEGSPATTCVSCHMPTRTYMVVDPRHDHSLRVPRPDLTVRDGTPNACNGCHADHDAAWAAAAIEEWFGPTRKGFQTFGPALAAGRSGAPGAADGLRALLADGSQPAIARATAASELERYPSPATLAAIRSALADGDALVRAAALDAVLGLPPQTRAPLAAGAADDDVKAVRVKAGRVLAALPPTALPQPLAHIGKRAVDEYVASERAVAERAESHLNLGIVAAERGDDVEAVAEYRAALARDPGFIPAYVNLADLHRSAGRDADAAAVVAEGLAVAPNDPSLLHALGLQRVRERRQAEALPLLKRAAEAQPANTRFAYVYGVALHSAGRGDEATAVLAAALGRAPYEPSLLSALAAFERDAGRRDAALDYARRLAAVVPDDESVRALVAELAGQPTATPPPAGG